jgi:uncharacterized protein YndB with AHSA1/START domain
MSKSEVKIQGQRLRIARVLNAPRPVVFGWWASAEKLRQWSGCKDATSCEVEMDFRTGGSFTQTMQIAGAGAFTIRGTYEEITIPEKIVYCADLGHALTRVVLEFSDQGAGTKVVLTQDGFPEEMITNIVSQGTSESFDKLDTLVGAHTQMDAHALAESR